jgi:diaminopimelate epimerase
MGIHRYHALGNDYLVAEAHDFAGRPAAQAVRLLCNRHRGVGGDGLLLWDSKAQPTFALKIFNPDGSLAEKSGNGLRIFARHLAHCGLVSEAPFTIVTDGGPALAMVRSDGFVEVDLGPPQFEFSRIPCSAPPAWPLLWRQGSDVLQVYPVGMGNPHAVLLRESLTESEVLSLGPLLERHAWFRNRTNVQFCRVIGRHRVELSIWERGVGRTAASGTSAAACVAVGMRLGLLTSPVLVEMAGGTLQVEETAEGTMRIRGPVTRIGECLISDEMWSCADV